MTKWRHYQCIPWDPCDQYYQLTDRWGLVPASQLPGVSIIIRVRDTRDQWPPWCEEMVISGYKHCLYLSHHWYFLPPPRFIDISFLFSGLNAIKQPQFGCWSGRLPSLPFSSASHQGWGRVRGCGCLRPAPDLAWPRVRARVLGL